VREGNVGEEWQGTDDSRCDNGHGSSDGAKQKPTQVATKAMKQYFEQCKKTNKVREMIFFKSLEKKKESFNELTMARKHNEARKRKAKHQSRNREQTRSAKKRKKVWKHKWCASELG